MYIVKVFLKKLDLEFLLIFVSSYGFIRLKNDYLDKQIVMTRLAPAVTILTYIHMDYLYETYLLNT